MKKENLKFHELINEMKAVLASREYYAQRDCIDDISFIAEHKEQADEFGGKFDMNWCVGENTTRIYYSRDEANNFVNARPDNVGYIIKYESENKVFSIESL